MSAIVTFALAGFDLEWIVGSIVVFEALLFITVLVLIICEVGFPLPKFVGLKGYIYYSIPLIPFGILMWVINASDRYLITHLLDISQAGIYSASYSLGSLITLFYFPIGYVLFPKLAQLWEQKQKDSVRNYLAYSSKLFLLFAIPAVAGLYILSQPLLKILARPEYMAGSELVLLVAFGILILGVYQINVYIIHLTKQTKWMPLMIFIAAAINIGLNIWLIPALGIMAAAISTIISFFVLAAIVIIWARRSIKFTLDIIFVGKIIISSIVMSLVVMFVPVDNMPGVILAVIVGVLMFGAMLIALRTFTKQDMNVLKELTNGYRFGLMSKEK